MALARKMALVLLFAFANQCAAAEGLVPSASIVDYFKSLGKPSDLASRKPQFEAKFEGEKYTGSKEQNQRWLVAILGVCPRIAL